MTYIDWLNNKFESVPPVGRIAIAVVLHIGLFLFYKLTVASDEAALNASIDKQIEKLQKRLTALQTSR